MSHIPVHLPSGRAALVRLATIGLLLLAGLAATFAFSTVREAASTARAGQSTTTDVMEYTAKIDTLVTATTRAHTALHTYMDVGQLDQYAEFRYAVALSRESRDALDRHTSATVDPVRHAELTRAAHDMVGALEAANPITKGYPNARETLSSGLVHERAVALREAAADAHAAAIRTAQAATASTDDALTHIQQSVSSTGLVSILALSLVGVLMVQRGRWARQRDRLLAQVSTMSRIDPLTGLANRLALGEAVTQALRTRRADGDPAMLMVDLDGFKAVNDTHGHSAGDDFLIRIGQELTAAVRRDDVVARVGGDEFVVLAARTHPARDLNDLVARLRAAVDVASTACATRWPGTPVTASVGLARPCDIPGNETMSAEELTEALAIHADTLMYEDKRSRRQAPPATPAVPVEAA